MNYTDLQKTLQAISERLDMLEQMALENVASKAKPAKKAKEDETIVYRHSRYYDDFGDISNLGGVTYAFKLHHDRGIAEVGIAICNKNDNFDRTTGRNIAHARLQMNPIEFDYVSGEDGGLVNTFWDAFNTEMINADESVIRMIEEADTDGLDEFSVTR